MRSGYKVILTRRVINDILQCSEYLLERSMDVDIALLWESSLHEHLKQLESFPTGYPLFEISPYRKLLHGQYVVLFRVDEIQSEVIVCRVFHGARLTTNIGAIET